MLSKLKLLVAIAAVAATPQKVETKRRRLAPLGLLALWSETGR